jgi:histidinol-phosphate aminotransferase
VATEPATSNQQPATMNKIKPVVRALAAYTLDPIDTPIKINQNENPFDMPEPIKREVEARLVGRAWSRYPDFVPTRLLERLAAFAGWRPDGVLAGNGSNELIQSLMMVTVAPGVKVAIAEPTFTLYKLQARVLGGEVVSIPLTHELQFDVPAIEAAISDGGADVLVLCSPNNPTGCRIETDDLARLCERFDGLVILDEAYHEFSGASAVPLLAAHPNLVVLRTFSKAMAMGGLRVGYMLAAPEIAVEVNKAKLPYNLNIFSMTAAEVAVERYDELLRPLVEVLVAERERVIPAVRAIDGLEPYPSHANFFVVRTTRRTPRELFDGLVERGILARDVSRYPMLSEFLRISIGTPWENDALLEALTSIARGDS